MGNLIEAYSGNDKSISPFIAGFILGFMAGVIVIIAIGNLL
jgi:hypothetical protein